MSAATLAAALDYRRRGWQLVQFPISEHAARRPGPDLPRLLWEYVRALGRAAYHWAGWAAPDEPWHGFRSRSRHELAAGDIDLAEMVAVIPNNAGWEEWSAIGMFTTD